MSDFTFPIPSESAALDEVDKRLGEQTQRLASVIQPIGEAMMTALASQQQGINAVVSRIQRQANAVNKANRAALAPVQQALADHVFDRLAQQRADLGTVQAAVAMADPGTGPIGLPPTSPAVSYWLVPGPLPGSCEVSSTVADAPRPGAAFAGPYADLATATEAASHCQGLPGGDGGGGAGGGPGGGVGAGGGVIGGGVGDGPTGWIVVCTEGQLQAWSQATLDRLGLTFTADEIKATFADEASARAFASDTVNWSRFCPGPGGGVGGGGGGGGGGGATACPVKWYCVATIDCGGIVVHTDASGSLIPDGPAFINGPFDSLDEANSHCGAPPPGPKPDPCVCPLAVPPDLGIPIPGTREWCEQLPKITALLAGLGNQVVTLLLDPPDLVLLEQDPGGPIIEQGGPFVAIREWILSSVNWLLKAVSSAACWLRSMVACWKQFTSVMSGCDSQTMLGLTVVKALVGLLKQVRIGITWPVAAHVQPTIGLIQVERAIDYIIESFCPSKILSVGEATQALKMGEAQPWLWQCVVKAHGYSVPEQERVLRASSHHVEGAQLIEWLRRHEVNADGTNLALINTGWLVGVQREMHLDLYNQIDSPHEALESAVKGVANPDYVAGYRLDDGFEEDFWTPYKVVLYAKGITHDQAAEMWRRHWRMPSYGECLQYLYRLRPGNEAIKTPFDINDLDAMLRVSGTAPLAVEWAKATAFRPLDQRYLDGLLDWGFIDSAQWESGVMDLGMSQAQMDQLRPMIHQDQTRRRIGQTGQLALPAIVEAIRTGVLAPAAAYPLTFGQGYQNAEVDRAVLAAIVEYQTRLANRANLRALAKTQAAVLSAYTVGTIDQGAALGSLLAIGFTASSGTALLAATDLTVLSTFAKANIASVKMAYMRGEVTLDQTSTLLGLAGVTGVRAGQYLQSWYVLRQAKRPLASTSQILKWTQEGLLSAKVAAQRLANLGWQQPELGLLGAELSLKLEKAQQSAVKDAQKKQPESKLKAWYIADIVDAAYVTSRLELYGYDNPTIHYLIEQWDQIKSKKKG